MRAFLEAGAPVGAFDPVVPTAQQPVLLAVEEWNDELLGVLIAHGALGHLSPERANPLAVAARRSNISALRLLLERDCPVSGAFAGRPALVEAADLGNLDILSPVIAAGAPLDEAFEVRRGLTPLVL